MNNLNNSIDNLSLAYIRTLSMEEIDKAGSGHPGIALGAAAILHTLYANIICANPKDPAWYNRDRFVLSAGHGSALLYVVLHLAGYGITTDDLKKFRELGSVTPGHPESGLTPGVDATTGPLGQGIAQAVGFAISEAYMRAKTNGLVNHYVYCLAGDGDLQEGISQEAISLAGNLGLFKLILLYDSNDVQLDTLVEKTNTEDQKKKFVAMGWDYQIVADGNCCGDIKAAIIKAKRSMKPSVIEIKTTIGYGSSLAGCSTVHGMPLPHDEVAKMREGLIPGSFGVAPEVYEYYRNTFLKRGMREYDKWNRKLKKGDFPFLHNVINNDALNLKSLEKITFSGFLATRAAGGAILDAIAKDNPSVMGGSADLATSTKAKGTDMCFSSANNLGRQIKYGVREHAMAGISLGLALDKLHPFASTFLTFADYMKPSIRLAAMQGLPVVFIFTHDSLAVGKDGPTHQPVEQLTMLRSIPNNIVLRPADANETKGAYDFAFKREKGPTCLILSRQKLPDVASKKECVAKGAYILKESKGKVPSGIILASGSEVSLALKVREELSKKGEDVRVVSVPSVELFLMQDKAYRDMVLPPFISSRMAIEMSDAVHFYRLIGSCGVLDNVSGFGASGAECDVLKAFGFTIDNLTQVYLKMKDAIK